MKRRTQAVELPRPEGMEGFNDFSNPEILAQYRAALAENDLVDGKLPTSITEKWEEVNGVRIARLVVDGANHKDLIFHIHGGAWLAGAPCTQKRAIIEIIDEIKVDMVSVEYGLSPEHPFPEGLMDCVTAYQYILEQGYEPERIRFVGESAGGNLCLALGLYCKDNNIPLPGGMVLISPVAISHDLKMDALYVKDNPLDYDAVESYLIYSMYIRDADPTDPYIAPANGDFTGFPPVMIQYGADETWFEDSLELTYKMMRDKVDVQSHSWEFMPHVFVFMLDCFPEAKIAQKEMKDYLVRSYAE